MGRKQHLKKQLTKQQKTNSQQHHKLRIIMGNSCECSKYGNEVQSLPSLAMEKGVQYRGRSITIGRIAGFEGANTGSGSHLEGATTDPKGTHGNYCHRDRQAIFSFHTALRNGDASKVMYFMETFPDLKLLQIPSKNGDTCLQIAIENQSYKLIIYLLDNGASVECPPSNSPLLTLIYCP